MQIDQGNQRANLQWQRQQIVTAAKKSAAQAAAYAKQAAPFGNESAQKAAAYAAQAARYAQEANLYFRDKYVAIAEYASDAAQAAANAKQAAAQAEIDSAIAKLEQERDEAIANLKAKYAPGTADLESKISTLKTQAAQLESKMSQAERENAHLRAKQLFQPKDPWRLLAGKVCNAKDASWVHFNGQILEIKPNGILVHGDFGPPLEAGFGERDYFVEDFPVQTYPMADGEEITASMNFVAYLGEKTSIYQFTNTTIDLRVNTVRRLDYGKIVVSPPPDLAQKLNSIVIAGEANPQITKQLNDNSKAQAAIEAQLSQLNSDFAKEREPIATSYAAKIKDVPNVFAQQAKEKEVAQKQAVVDKVVKFNQDAADKGDVCGLLRMGERYRDGDGVPKDLAKAKDYLTKAAAAGSPTAEDDLKNLSTKTVLR